MSSSPSAGDASKRWIVFVRMVMVVCLRGGESYVRKRENCGLYKKDRYGGREEKRRVSLSLLKCKFSLTFSLTLSHPFFLAFFSIKKIKIKIQRTGRKRRYTLRTYPPNLPLRFLSFQAIFFLPYQTLDDYIIVDIFYFSNHRKYIVYQNF